jgi:uncharacterized protein (DUF1330 family)
MSRLRFEKRFALVLLLLYAAFYLWQTPGLIQGRLSESEIDAHLAVLKASPAIPEPQRSEVIRDLRKWALEDDGQPVYMVNLLRYYEKIQPIPGVPEIQMTPEASNAYYEEKVTAMAFKAGDYPIFAGKPQGNNVVGREPDADNWTRVLVMRYPSRRHVLALFCSPDYLQYAPYKLAALKINLVPTSAELVLSDLRVLAAAAMLVLFLSVAWARALRRAVTPVV